MSGTQQVGVIHEQGFYGNGLGYDPLSDKDQQTLNEKYNDKNQSGNDDREEGR